MLRSTATFSPCRTFRFSLTRVWDSNLPRVAFIGLNPSTADETADDPTIRRCVGFARRWGFGSLVVVNCFAFKSTDPKGLRRSPDPIGPDNDRAIIRVVRSVDRVVAAWGAHGRFLERDTRILAMLPSDAMCLGVTRDGSPRHPLYLPSDTRARPLSALISSENATT